MNNVSAGRSLVDDQDDNGSASIAHDFRNLLQCATSALYLTKRRLIVRDESELAAFVADALDALDRANLLAQRLLSAVPQPGRRQPASVQQLVLSMRSMLRHVLGSDIRLDTLVCETLPPVRCDLRDLERAILNLAINARDAMPDGGHLVIEVRGCHSRRHPAPCVAVAVRDTGHGMSAEVAQQAFRPYFSTKEPGSGTGLGLSSVRKLAEELGGSAELSSGVEGTTVAMHLPATVQEDSRS